MFDFGKLKTNEYSTKHLNAVMVFQWRPCGPQLACLHDRLGRIFYYYLTYVESETVLIKSAYLIQSCSNGIVVTRHIVASNVWTSVA